ncbi:type II 3-dehydroquinate dehydratase [Sphingomicrobium marinum]|uniref:type II 3-dehydroquinate dehydratase n=1 Tax=Sphingomicrobium marinum TaxID=1227950 RepID=UPI0022404A6F|nr:type II 3-dehydroquinate dehydratase [Sphingomicrobium marinum]
MSSLPMILVLHGPNLDRLGRREPELYGDKSLKDVNAMIVDRAATLDVGVTMRQSNHEGQLIDWLYEAEDEGVEGVILNAAGFTHTSVALRDAIAAVNVPVIEVHLTNTAKREDFRQRSLIAPVCTGTISGFGVNSYLLALDAASRFEER